MENVQAGGAERGVSASWTGVLLQVGTAAVVGRDSRIQAQVRRQVVAPLRRGDCEREGGRKQAVTDIGHVAAALGTDAGEAAAVGNRDRRRGRVFAVGIDVVHVDVAGDRERALHLFQQIGRAHV